MKKLARWAVISRRGDDLKSHGSYANLDYAQAKANALTGATRELHYVVDLAPPNQPQPPTVTTSYLIGRAKKPTQP